MKSTLLFTFALFLTACSDNTVHEKPKAESVTQQVATPKQAPVIQTAPVKQAAPLKAVATVVKDETPVNGHTLYLQKCASCHGKNGEKPALNKSQIISGWNEEKTFKALKGYQDGSYGESMKAIMKGQVSTLSDEQMSAIAEYIATL